MYISNYFILDNLAKLEKNWDSYGADPPNELAIKNCKTFIDVNEQDEYKLPKVKPSVCGGIGMTFRGKDKLKVYIEFNNDGDCFASFTDGEIINVKEVDQSNYREFLLKVYQYIKEIT